MSKAESENKGALYIYNRYEESIHMPLSDIIKPVHSWTDAIYHLPLFICKVAAGFPSPADDYMEGVLDLNRYLIKNPASTYLIKAKGLAMKNAGIYPGDLLIVDRSIDPRHGKIVIAAMEGDLTVRRLYEKNGKILLLPENKDFQPIDITKREGVIIWGVVTYVIRSV